MQIFSSSYNQVGKLKDDKNLNGIYIEAKYFSQEMEQKFNRQVDDNPNLTILSECASKSFKKTLKKSFN